MANKMLIDAAHPEETRVVVLRGNRVEEFDFESASRKPLRGNIYLAKVTRVEPSLQAAFVDYGGNRHGFLAFSEIHPDYYQIPVADRQALIEAEEREAAAADSDLAATDKDAEASEAAEPEAGGSIPETTPEAAAETAGLEGAAIAEPASETSSEDEANTARSDSDEDHDHDSNEVVSDQSVESVGAEDALEEVPERTSRPRLKQYKIQEVIRRRQILLVQVVKEERGNKGAALTTYLSLAGRYCVLMPNTARGGGISRKITSLADRKRLKQLVGELDVPEGMGVILRTAGASRTKAELKRDFEYLLRLWENVRELTLKSSAPTLVYEEGSLIKRSIRDLYNKDIDEVLVAGEDAYREAKDFMRMLMPSHAKNVQPYRESQPLFARSGIEAQLDAMFSPQVTLRSGGYIVINQTEALVSIDVNSGRSTREHSIEDTAHQTNLEAADEVARQLRLRDLAGLVVIDFIDMEEKRNNRSVERRLKEALKNDRARIQVGRISHFGLLEMSRQRIRTGVFESTTTVCAVCQGTGHVRAPSSVALHVLRSLEDQLLRGVTHHLTIRTRTAVALYILNQKRAHLSELEERFGLHLTVLADESVVNGSHFLIERGEPVEPREVRAPSSIHPDSIAIADVEPEEVEPAAEIEDEDDDEAAEAASERGDTDQRREREEGGRRRRRRRRRRGGRDGQDQEPREARSESAEQSGESDESDEDAADEESGEESVSAASDDENGNGQRRRRRGRRGGRRSRRGNGEEQAAQETTSDEEQPAAAAAPFRWPEDRFADPYEIDTTPVIEPRRETAQTTDEEPPVVEAESSPVAESEPAPASEEAEVRQPEPAEATTSEAPAASEAQRAQAEPEPEDESRPKRSGWWQRRSFF